MTAYIPILKAKKYDLKGVNRLAPNELADVLPLFEIPMPSDDWSERKHVIPHQDKIAYLLHCKIGEIAKAVGSHPFCMDISSWSSSRLCSDGRHIVDHLIGNAISSNTNFSICLNYGAWDDPIYQSTLTSNRKYISILRLESFAIEDSADEIYFEDKMLQIASVAQLDTSTCVVLIDFSSLLNQNIQDKCRTLRKMTTIISNLGFKNIGVSGSSVPQLISEHVGNDSEVFMTRFELDLFDDLLNNARVENPIYSDYGVRSAGPTADVIAPHANAKMRYTISGGYMLHRGVSKIVKRLVLQHPSMANIIRQSSYFMGGLYSWGDSEIFALAAGGLGEWIAIDTNHHVKFVAVEAANSIGFRITVPATATTA